ncbi:hypothetical protein [Sorangium sp. So ce124]|uniref:hypothetical protein n=1 Tax=Sorangium sp. So ce124 TaxID=3133280 RepID=UPI003F5DE55B
MAELLDDPSAELADIASERWSIAGFEQLVIDTRERLQSAGIERLRLLRRRLAAIFFPSLDLVASRDPSSATAIDVATAPDPRLAPSVLIPLWFELYVLVAPPVAMSTPQLERYSAHSAIVLAGMARHRAFRPLGAELLQRVAAIYRKACALVTAQMTIDAALRLVSDDPKHPDNLEARVLLLEAFYDNLCAADDETPPLKDELRESIAVARLKFLDEELGPAIEERDIAKNTSDREKKRSRAALEHRRLTWQASRAAARREIVGDRDEKWCALTHVYDEVGEPENAAGALSVLIDDALDIIERRPTERENLRGMLGQVAEELAARLVNIRYESARDRRQLLRRVAEAYAVAEPSRAFPFVDEALTSIQQDLKDARGDVFSRSIVLSDADDWLGVLLGLEFPPADAFARAYEALRGRPLEQLARHPGTSVIRWHVTRRGSAGGVSSEDHPEATWSICQEAHQLARTLDLIRALTFKDVETFRKTKRAPQSADTWKELIDRLVGQLAITPLARRGAPATGRWIIETDGLGVHVPLAGALLKASQDAKAIAMAKLGKVSEGQPPTPETARAVVINAFTPGESLHGEVERYAKRLGTTSIQARTAEEVRGALADADASLVVFGCHGSQSSITGPLVLQLPAGAAPAEDVFKGLRLRGHATVVAVTCFAAAGASSGESEWSSLPELMLRAGARAVVANRWHAWFEVDWHAFQALLEGLLRASVAPTAWPAVEAATAFMSRVCRISADPRQWCGWATWTRREYLV